jgi:hypothetical protein
VDITLFFDLETYMLLSETRRIAGDKVKELEETWSWMFPHLKAYRLGERKGYLVIYLDRALEDKLDALLDEDESKGEEAQTLAQAMIMAAMLESLPEAGLTSCAPIPEPNKVLKRSLAKLGLEFYNSGRMNVRFGVLTKLPFSGGCDNCFIKSTCAKRIMSGK